MPRGHSSHVADAHMTKPDFGRGFYTLNPSDSDMTVTLLPEQHTNLAPVRAGVFLRRDLPELVASEV
jgi:hypothetical protein